MILWSNINFSVHFLNAISSPITSSFCFSPGLGLEGIPFVSLNYHISLLKLYYMLCRIFIRNRKFSCLEVCIKLVMLNCSLRTNTVHCTVLLVLTVSIAHVIARVSFATPWVPKHPFLRNDKKETERKILDSEGFIVRLSLRNRPAHQHTSCLSRRIHLWWKFSSRKL